MPNHRQDRDRVLDIDTVSALPLMVQNLFPHYPMLVPCRYGFLSIIVGVHRQPVGTGWIYRDHHRDSMIPKICRHSSDAGNTANL